MADILIIGIAPTSEEGKEYFLHCLDWWWEILLVIERLLNEHIPVDAYFVREFPFAATAPKMDAEDSRQFSILLEEILQNGSARTCLRQIYRDDPVLLDHYGNDGDLLKSNLDERIEQLETFTRFLKSCGGCNLKWYSPED